MSNPFDFFQYKACINLPSATDRWNLCLAEFSKIGINDQVEQLFVTPPPDGLTIPNLTFAKGNVGANLSHTKALIHSLVNNASSCLVFEDDFYTTPNCLSILESAIQELPDDWDVLFLGGNPTEPMKRYSKNLLKPSKMLGAFSYAVSKKFIPTLLDLTLDKLAERPFDTVLSNCCNTSQVFSVNSPVCKTRPGASIVRDMQHRSYEKAITDNWRINTPP